MHKMTCYHSPCSQRQSRMKVSSRSFCDWRTPSGHLYVLKLQAERLFSLDDLVVPSSEAPNFPFIGDHQHGLIFWQSIIGVILQDNHPAYDLCGASLPSIPLRKLLC
jgi:hypothetical protein